MSNENGCAFQTRIPAQLIYDLVHIYGELRLVELVIKDPFVPAVQVSLLGVVVRVNASSPTNVFPPSILLT